MNEQIKKNKVFLFQFYQFFAFIFFNISFLRKINLNVTRKIKIKDNKTTKKNSFFSFMKIEIPINFKNYEIYATIGIGTFPNIQKFDKTLDKKSYGSPALIAFPVKS